MLRQLFDSKSELENDRRMFFLHFGTGQSWKVTFSGKN